MSIETYIEAKSTFHRHQEQVTNQASLLAAVAEALKRQPGRMIFSNTPGGLPMEASMSSDSVSFNANDIRTPAQMQEMLATWHKLRDAMMDAWRTLSEDARANVSPPDDLGRPSGGRDRSRGSWVESRSRW